MNFDTKFLTVSTNVESSQSKNCWMFIQVGTCAFYLWRFWRMDNSDTALRLDYFGRGRVMERKKSANDKVSGRASDKQQTLPHP